MSDFIGISQFHIYQIFNDKNPLRELAFKNPTNMCWLTTLFYALQFLGLENNKKLHIKLTYLLSSSLGLLFINKENGAMLFPKKYELSDGYIKKNLNKIFAKASLGVEVITVLSDIKFPEISQIEAYTKSENELVAIVKNSNLNSIAHNIVGTAANHAIVIKECHDLQNGRIQIVFIDPSDGKFHLMEVGVNIFMQWIQYVWVLKRKYTILEKIINLTKPKPKQFTL